MSDFDDECKSKNFDLSNGSPINHDNFNIVHYNINSILAPDRLNQLTDSCRTLNIDVLIITESKVDQTIPNNLLTIAGYHEPIRHDRTVNGRHGGGVLIYIAENLVYQHKKDLQSEYYEHVWVDVRLKNTVFAINAFYRPPNESASDHQHFMETAETILNNLNNYVSAKYKVIASDLNFGNCYCKYPILPPKPLDSVAPDLFSSFGFQQLIDIPTRITAISISLIDLIFVNKPDDIICHGTIPKIADHDGTVVSFNTKSNKPKQKTRIIYDYNNADVPGLIKHFKEYDFHNLVFSQPTINQTEIYTEVLKQAFDQFIPCKTAVIRPTDQSWCNNFTRLLLRKKNRNYQIYK